MEPLNLVEILGVAASLSLLAGWRLYAAVLATGLAVRFGGLEFVGLPGSFGALHVLGTPAVLGVAAVGTLAEFFADKLPWLDSLWDLAHSLIRPVGGALLALAVIAPDNGALAVITFLLGGGAAFAAHAAKAGSRAVLNTSPEPVSNWTASFAEDGLTAAGLWLVVTHPQWAALLALALALLIGLLLWWALRLLAPLRRGWRRLWGVR